MIDNLIRAATCRVSCGDKSGTGHLVTEHNILTARHCVIPAIESETPIELIFWGPEGDITLTASIVAHSEELDACILFIAEPLERQPISMNSAMPREGVDWRSFGYPIGKTFIGHRIVGTISHVLNVPKLKMDIDLTVDPSNVLNDYRGLSGAAVVCENASRGMIRLKADRTIGAISHQQLEGFLVENGIQVPNQDTGTAESVEQKSSLANRSEFQEKFEQIISGNPGNYVFLEGAHGIGKTTFCREFEPENSALYSLGTYSLALQGRGPGTIYRAQPDVFFEWLSTAVSTLITGKPSRKEERNYPTLVQQASELLEAFSDYCSSINRHGILFLDGLNEAQSVDSTALVKLIGLLPQSLPQKLTIVLTAPNYNNVAGILSGRVKSDNLISLPPLGEEASTAYCWQELRENIANPALVAQICEKAKGHPLYLRYLIEYANSKTEGDTLDDFPTLTGPIEEYYESLWTKLLEDENAVQLLAIMARLRWGIGTSDLLKVLTATQQTVFIPTVARIRHMLLNPDTTTLYHPSFTEFLISKTSSLEIVVQQQLAEFCIKETRLEYCVLNVVFHLLRADDAGRSQAVAVCNQDWVDKCVELGVEPDTLLFDVEATVRAAVNYGPAVEAIRLLLLSQRVSFRYNSLFAQSALLIAEALIALGRPREALKHAIRFNSLIVDPDEALQIAFSLIQHKYPDEALELLQLLYQRILETYAFKLDLHGFIRLCKLHLRALFFMRLADGQGRMRQIFGVLNHAVRVFEASLTEEPQEFLEECRIRVHCVFTSYFLCFRNTYTSLEQLKEKMGEEVPPGFLLGIIWALLESQETIETYNLPKEIASLSQVLSDIDELVKGGADFDKQLVNAVVDILIQLGAPSSVVHLIADKGEKLAPHPLKIKAENGVDVDFQSIHRDAAEWSTVAFLNSDFDCPLVGAFHEKSWLSTLDQLTRALSWCEGMARRAKADRNETQKLQTLECLKTRVQKSLAFTLAQRVKWQDSYAIPEDVFPLIYERIVLLLIDCYPEELSVFLRDLSARAIDQCGLYTEGFRDVMFSVLKKLTIREIEPSLFDEIFGLLQHYKEHVVRGVENRHELVPELLKLIPLYVRVGATEEAEGLYRYMLSVSMGPSWYKEDQLGLMVSVLRKMPPTDNMQETLPLIAGYLERASGEMTFQRFVRYEKHALIAELFRRGRFVGGCRYFKRQTCGTTAELLSECQQGLIDKPSPTIGMRHPGGALDEQEAILKMVQNASELDWRLRWALLEIFQFGDERHLDDYATEYASIINQAGIDAAVISEMVRRTEFVVGGEIEFDEQSRFQESFLRTLDAQHHDAFAKIMPHVSKEDSQPKMVDPVSDDDAADSSKVGSIDEDRMFFPGIFGRQSAMKTADEALAIAEAQLKLRNFEAARSEAVKVLQVLQDGGWCIWGNLSKKSDRAEELLREGTITAADVIRYYAPLLEAERHEAKWRLAEHLVTKTADLLSDEERSQLLNFMVNHVALMVGDATNKIEMFSFLKDEPPCDGSMELFRLVVWLIDHPHWLRREKASAMAAWLVENDPKYFEEAVKEAFSMVPGYSADVLSGVFDNMSTRQPQHLWDRIFALIDLDEILRDCKHSGRLIVLLRLAERAGVAGSSSGTEVASRIREQFRPGAIELGVSDRLFDLPRWARSISGEWETLDQLGIASNELVRRIEENLSQLCAPLDVQGGWMLERAVSTSFREETKWHLNRWEAKVRFALNTAILPYISKENFRKVELTLRIFNPSRPERTLTPVFASSADAMIAAITADKDYSSAIGNEEFYFLNYNEVARSSEDEGWTIIEVLAVVIPTSNFIRGLFSPTGPTSFSSKQFPNLRSTTTHYETCCSVSPDFAFFGSFTPAVSVPSFTEMIGAKEIDYQRINWRNGRSSDMRYFGRPIQEGCLLAVRRSAVRLPEGKKLAWIIRKDGEVVTMVDSQNNRVA